MGQSPTLDVGEATTKLLHQPFVLQARDKLVAHANFREEEERLLVNLGLSQALLDNATPGQWTVHHGKQLALAHTTGQGSTQTPPGFAVEPKAEPSIEAELPITMRRKQFTKALCDLSSKEYIGPPGDRRLSEVEKKVLSRPRRAAPRQVPTKRTHSYGSRPKTHNAIKRGGKLTSSTTDLRQIMSSLRLERDTGSLAGATKKSRSKLGQSAFINDREWSLPHFPTSKSHPIALAVKKGRSEAASKACAEAKTAGAMPSLQEQGWQQHGGEQGEGQSQAQNQRQRLESAFSPCGGSAASGRMQRPASSPALGGSASASACANKAKRSGGAAAVAATAGGGSMAGPERLLSLGSSSAAGPFMPLELFDPQELSVRGGQTLQVPSFFAHVLRKSQFPCLVFRFVRMPPPYLFISILSLPGFHVSMFETMASPVWPNL